MSNTDPEMPKIQKTTTDSYRLSLFSTALLLLYVAAPLVGYFYLLSPRERGQMTAEQYGALTGKIIVLPLLAFFISYGVFRATRRSARAANITFVIVLGLAMLATVVPKR